MSPRYILIFFGLAHSFALLPNNLQSIVNEELMPSDLVKMKAVHPNWRDEGIFKRITKDAGLFVHRETNEIILETKEKLWTESEIISKSGYRRDEFKNLIETKNWNEFFLRYLPNIGVKRWNTNQLKNYWSEAMAEIVDMTEYVYDETVLMRAVRYEGPNIVNILLERGADVSAKNSNGWTALHLAAYYDRIDAIKLLLKFGAQINATDNLEENPLMWAVRYMNVGAVKLLLERDARLDLKNKYEETAFDIAKSYKYRDRNDSRYETIIILLSHSNFLKK